MDGGASFFREDMVVVDPKEAPPTENDPLLKSENSTTYSVEKSTDGETADDGSTSVNKRQKNQHRRHS